jgi:hypothetical protein
MKKLITKTFYKITDFLGWCCVEMAVKCYHMDRFPKMADRLYKAGCWLYVLAPVVPAPETSVTDTEKEFMYDWHMHYNPYTSMWSAYHRDDRVAYVCGEPTTHPVWTDKTFCGVLDKLAIMNHVDSTPENYEYESGY